ncbi:MAG: hypothetical protein HY718_19730, partial [Planctomycetes bacterium]|nr:hypothetical protein [Planctomycetota bacterium]
MATATLAQSRIGPIMESIDRLVSTEIEAKPGETRGSNLKQYEAARSHSGKPLLQGA